MTGGKGLDRFRDEMLNDKHILMLHDFPNARYCFDNVEIKGGICYFLRDTSRLDICTYFLHDENGKVSTKSNRYLKEEGNDILIRDSRLINIKEKVLSNNEKTFDSIVSSMKPYGIRGDFFSNQEKYKLPEIFIEPFDKGYTIIGLDEAKKRVKRYVDKNYPIPKINGLNNYKIFQTNNF